MPNKYKHLIKSMYYDDETFKNENIIILYCRFYLFLLTCFIMISKKIFDLFPNSTTIKSELFVLLCNV